MPEGQESKTDELVPVELGLRDLGVDDGGTRLLGQLSGAEHAIRRGRRRCSRREPDHQGLGEGPGLGLHVGDGRGVDLRSALSS